MPHTIQTYRYDTEAEAVAARDRFIADKSPDEDRYVDGPFLETNNEGAPDKFAVRVEIFW